MDSEDLWRAALHDFNNLMAGLQGVMDLGDPALPFDPCNHARLETILEDGKTLIGMARAMALGSLPGSEPVPWAEWEAGLRDRFDTLGSLFRCPIGLVDAGADGTFWPAPLFQDWAVAFTRQILPWAAPGPLRLEAEVLPGVWVLRWVTDAPIPPALQAEPSRDALGSLPALWLRGMASHMNLKLEASAGCLQARIPRRNTDSPLLQES